MDQTIFISAHAAGLAGFPPLVARHAVMLSGDAPAWVHLLPLGNFSGRDGRGPYIIASRKEAEQIITASMARAGDADLPIDYDHQSDFSAVPGVGGTAPAAAWIKALEVRDDGIWGQVEWTVRAAQHLAAREYRYLSPVFEHNKAGQVTRLLRAGLTNNPNLELAAVATAFPINTPEDHMDLLKQLIALYGLPATATMETVMAASATAHSASSTLTAIATAVGASVDDKAEKIITAIQSAGSDPKKFVPIDALTTVQSQLATLQASVQSDRAIQAVDAAIKNGTLIPAMREWGLNLFKQDEAAFIAYASSAPVVLTSGASAALDGQRRAAGDLSPEEIAVCTQMGISPDDFKKNKPKES